MKSPSSPFTNEIGYEISILQSRECTLAAKGRVEMEMEFNKVINRIYSELGSFLKTDRSNTCGGTAHSYEVPFD